MGTTIRVLGLLDLLQDRGWVSGPELARRLEVEPRMLRRDVTRLQELGIPVESQLGRHGGYRLRPGYRLPPLMRNDDEARAVALALTSARELGLGTSAPAIETALAKIHRVLPAPLAGRLKTLEAALGFATARPARGAVRADILLILAEAVRTERRARILYTTPGRPERERDVDAYGVVVVGGRWYLAAHDHLSGEHRVFRVDRIRSASLAAAEAPVPAGFDPIAFVERSLARVPWRWSIELLAEASLDEVRATVRASVAELEATRDGVVVRIQADDLAGAARMLAAVPWTFQLVGPPELAAALAVHAQRLLTMATGSRRTAADEPAG